MKVTLKKELIDDNDEYSTQDDVVLTLTEHRDVGRPEGKMNPFYCLEIKQGLEGEEYIMQLTFFAKQKEKALKMFEMIRYFDNEQFYLDKYSRPEKKDFDARTSLNDEDCDIKVHEIRGIF